MVADAAARRRRRGRRVKMSRKQSKHMKKPRHMQRSRAKGTWRYVTKDSGGRGEES